MHVHSTWDILRIVNKYVEMSFVRRVGRINESGHKQNKQTNNEQTFAESSAPVTKFDELYGEENEIDHCFLYCLLLI